MKRILIAVLTAVLLPISAHSAVDKKSFRVVIDPGHGGNDLGTHLRNGKSRVTEKDVTLVLAREAARQLAEQGYDVYLTRNGDDEVSLPKRTAMANKLKANVFLSIHMNSTPQVATGSDTDTPEGIETYILNNASDASSKRLAHLENAVVSPDQETDSAQQLDVALILKDLRLDANLSESKRLACALQKNLVTETTVRNRGVKQALFHVLLGADMPSVLIEAGFLTNSNDRSFALSSNGQAAIGKAIVKAVDQYRTSTKGTPQAKFELSSCKVN